MTARESAPFSPKRKPVTPSLSGPSAIIGNNNAHAVTRALSPIGYNGGMRAVPLLAAAGLALAVSGCGGSGHKPAASTAPYGPASDPVSLSKCMRANGVSNFPDPVQGPGGEGLSISESPGRGGTLTVAGIPFSGPAFTAAEKTCKEYLPGASGPPPAPTAAQLKQNLKLAECMRRNGVPNFPDPGGHLAAKVLEADSNSPAFLHAAKVCAGPGGAIQFTQ